MVEKSLPACDETLFQELISPMSFAEIRMSGVIYFRQVIKPWDPGRVSDTPPPLMFYPQKSTQCNSNE